MNTRSSTLWGIILGLGLSASAAAAPLFPDVPDNHWSQSAVAALAAKGVIEGYPDGTFKGDRHSTRWEMAMCVARLLSKMEVEHSTFATDAELKQLQRLAAELKPELEALGARVDRLENAVSRLDQRVSEIERITFYGEYKARYGAQSLRNVGEPGLGDPFILNYNDAVGTASGAGGIIPAPSAAAGLNMNPFVIGILGVDDWQLGRPLLSGITATNSLMLGTRVKLSPDFDGGAEFAAYSSLGNSILDAYWGVSAPHLSSPFTSDVGSPAQGEGNNPWTKLSLDNFWIRHNPSKTTLVLGAFKDTNFDPLVYVGEQNPNAYGNKYYAGYGFKLNGQADLAADASSQLLWEVMGTKLADGNVNAVLPTSTYNTHTEGLNLEYLFNKEHGNVKFSFLHTANDAGDSGALQTGLIQTANYTLNWVNPNGYYISQLNALEGAGVGSVSDIRPIPMIGAVGNDGITGVPGVPNVGGIGPQAMTTLGASARYEFENRWHPSVAVEYGHTNYKPQRNSAYSVDGNALRAKLGVSLFERTFDVNAEYVSVDPTYDPFVLPYPTVGDISTVLWRTPGFTYYNNLYSLHDTETFTHNREGWRASLNWKFARTGAIGFEYGRLQQKRTSMQDVRYSAGCLAPGTPNTTVFGFSPGYMDPVFGGFSQATYASDGINDLAIPLEDPVGYARNWRISAGYKYLLEPRKSARGIKLSGGARSVHFTRNSNLSQLVSGPAGIAGESMNYVNLYIDGWLVALDYDVSNNFRLHGAYNSVDIYGHLDHLGTMSQYAIANNTSKFDVLNMEQRVPELGVEWDVSEAITWGALGKFYFTKDRMKTDLYSNPSIPAVNVYYGPQTGGHPFSWQGYQVTTYLNFKF